MEEYGGKRVPKRGSIQLSVLKQSTVDKMTHSWSPHPPTPLFQVSGRGDPSSRACHPLQILTGICSQLPVDPSQWGVVFNVSRSGPHVW